MFELNAKQRFWISQLLIVILIFYIGFVAQAKAQDEFSDFESKPAEEEGNLSAEAGIDEGDPTSSPPQTEEGQIEKILAEFPYKLDKDKDPFKPLVVKKVAVLPTVAPKPVVAPKPTPAVPPPPPVPPLKMDVLGIVGNDSERLALVRFENEILTLKKDEDPKGKFKVVEILPDKVVVYSTKEQMRRTFSLGGGGK